MDEMEDGILFFFFKFNQEEKLELGIKFEVDKVEKGSGLNEDF